MSQEIDELRELNRTLGRLAERSRIIRIAEKLGLSNEIGEYVYVSDLIEYIEDESEPGDE